METPSRYTFSPDGNTKVFPIPVTIKGENYVRIDVDSVTINDRNRYDIVNNSVVFVDVTDVPNGSQLDVLVVQTDEGITNLGAVISVDIVAQNIASVNTVAGDIASVNTVATDIASVVNTSANIAIINTVAGDIASVNTAATNIVAIKDAPAAAAAAEQSEINAAGHALVAGTHATNAGNDRALAQTAKTEAETAAINAVLAANSAEAAWDFFDDRYLGSKASAPTLDNDGDPLVAGTIYWNSTGSALQIYNGSSWEDVATLSSTPSFTSVSADDFLVDVQAGMVLGAPDQVDFITSNTVRMSVDTNGNVGIGTSSPNATLEIDGNAIAKTDTDTTNTGSVTLDFAANQNFVLTLTGNVTLVNPTTEQVGQSGFIVLIQDGTGGRTVSLGTDYETAGGAGLTLSATAGATDIVPYIVAASGRILLGTPQLAFA